jgi:hypothetical protein
MESRRMTEMFRLHAKSDGTVKDIVESYPTGRQPTVRAGTLTEEQVLLF